MKIAASVLLLLASVVTAFAKMPTVAITISGPRLTKPIVSTDKNMVGNFNPYPRVSNITKTTSP
jgi:hypothetical protein